VKAATSTIPIVMAPAGDAVGSGVVANLARPDGNITGLSLALVEMAGKTMELVHATVPQAKRLACLVHEKEPLHVPFLAEAECYSRALGPVISQSSGPRRSLWSSTSGPPARWR
jgi:putative ABC transport system substrate-binding protein